METLESSRVCRLCGKKSGMCIDIFDKRENHVRKINAVLPILVHEMDLLPKQMCHGCNYKLEEFHKFYVDCLKTDADLKSQLSWMRKGDSKEEISIPMVQIESLRIKTEPPDYDIYDLDPVVENVNYINSMSTMTFPINRVKNSHVFPRSVDNVTEQFTYNNAFANCERCNCNCDTRSRTKEAYSADCAKTKSRRKLYRNIGTTKSGNTSRISKSTLKTIIANDTLTGARKHIVANNSSKKSSMNILEHQASEFQQKPTFRIFKEFASLNTDNILDTNEVKIIEIKKEQSDDVEIRSLRPRKGSVDYIGTKRKISSRSNSEKRSRSAETEKTDTSNPEIILLSGKVGGVNVGDENVEPRSLRPRKNSVDYLGPKRKGNLRRDLEPRSRSEEGHYKRHKPSNIVAEITNPCLKLNVSDTYSETIDFVIKRETLADLEEPAPIVQVKTERKEKMQTKGFVRNLTESFDTLNAAVTVKVEENSPASAMKKDEQITSCSKSTKTSKSLTRATKNKLKSGKIVIKRLNNKNVRSSPKYLRSQDIGHLRNGKIKKLDSDRSSIRRLKQKLEKIGVKKSAVGKKLPKAIKQNVNMIKVPTTFNTVDHHKLHCEKCCAYFAHKEVFKLHPCYDNKAVCTMK